MNLQIKFTYKPVFHILIGIILGNAEVRVLVFADHEILAGYGVRHPSCNRPLLTLLHRQLPRQWDSVHYLCKLWTILLIGLFSYSLYLWLIPIGVDLGASGFKSKRNTERNAKVKTSLSKNFLNRYVRLALWLYEFTTDRPMHAQVLRLVDRIYTSLQRNGRAFTTEYLKESYRLVQHWYSGEPTCCPQVSGGPRVASRRGLPLIIPGPLRLRLEAGDEVLLKLVLTVLSVFRIIKYPGKLKLETITNPFTGESEELPVIEVALVWKRFLPYLPDFPISKLARHFPLVLKTAGPNFRISVLGAPLDALAWSKAPKELWEAAKILSDHCGSDLWNFIEKELSVVSGWTPKKELKLGKLSKKAEPAGKIRVFAIVDVWTQTVLEPLHQYIFLILKKIDQDGTFDQSRPLSLLMDKLRERPDKWVASYDLSAATDRLPIKMQVQVLSQLLGNRVVAEAWRELLVGRDYSITGESQPIRYSVGQPMGALSSWGMLALSHHFIVQVAAKRVGYPTWFADYALLGDDIVIADKAVAMAYLALIRDYLGVDINLSKSLVSRKGVAEFAKRLVSPDSEVTPVGAKNLSGVLKNPAHLPSLFIDLIGKGEKLDWLWVDSRLNELLLKRDLIRINKGGVEAIKWTVLQPFGFVPFPGLTSSQIVNSQGEELYDPMVVYQSIVWALNEFHELEQDKALEKSMESANKLHKLIRRADHSIPPSFQYVLHDAEAHVKRAMQLMQQPGMIEPVDPSGKTLSEIFLILHEAYSAEAVSPLDNVLQRPKVLKPRIRKLNFDFFKRVRKYCEALQGGEGGFM